MCCLTRWARQRIALGHEEGANWLGLRLLCSPFLPRLTSPLTASPPCRPSPLPLSQCFMLTAKHRELLQRPPYNVHVWHVEQHEFEAVWIPGGCAHQVGLGEGGERVRAARGEVVGVSEALGPTQQHASRRRPCTPAPAGSAVLWLPHVAAPAAAHSVTLRQAAPSCR